MMPLLLISGILYMYPSYFSSFISFIGGLKVVAVFHYIMAIIFTAFFVAHICLATTGHTMRPLQNAPFRPISASGSNFNPQNTQCIPAVKIFAFLELERN